MRLLPCLTRTLLYRFVSVEGARQPLHWTPQHGIIWVGPFRPGGRVPQPDRPPLDPSRKKANYWGHRALPPTVRTTPSKNDFLVRRSL